MYVPRSASASTRSKSSVVTAATSASSSSGQGASASGARDLGVDDRAAVPGVHLAQPRAVEHAAASTSTRSRRRRSSSVSSSALSSRVWNGLIGVSRPGEKVIRLGVDISSTPAGPQHPDALGDELCLIPQMLDDLEVDHDIDRRVGQRQLGQVAVHAPPPADSGPARARRWTRRSPAAITRRATPAIRSAP